MWLIVKYRPSALFSLRPANATTGGSKTLILPTPFAIKMALLDIAIRVNGQSSGEQWFPELRDLAIAIQLPRHLSVVSMFTKIRRPFESKSKVSEEEKISRKKEDKEWPWGSSVSFREFVQYSGDLEIAFRQPTNTPLKYLASQVNYFGKRGGFVQFVEYENRKYLADSFTLLTPKPGASFLAQGLLQVLDDCVPEMTFEQANIYSKEKAERLHQSIVLPYRLAQSSRGFTLYERIDE